MISELFLSVLFGISSMIINLLPDFVFNVFDGTAALGTVVSYALYFFPGDLWLFCLGQGIIKMGITFAYAVAEWTWKKVPGVD